MIIEWIPEYQNLWNLIWEEEKHELTYNRFKVIDFETEKYCHDNLNLVSYPLLKDTNNDHNQNS